MESAASQWLLFKTQKLLPSALQPVQHWSDFSLKLLIFPSNPCELGVSKSCCCDPPEGS